MARGEKSKICFVLPNYDPAAGSHFFHVYEFLEAASAELDIFVIIEKAAIRPPWPSERFYVQKFSFPPFRFLEIFALLLRERLRGRGFCYTHYSFYGALASWLVIRLLGGVAYYWNSGMPWLYPRPRFQERVFRFILRHTILVTNPPGLGAEYQRRYGLNRERIRIVPHYISVERFAEKPPCDEARLILGIPLGAKVILFIHRLSRRKGAHLLPEIISGVTKQAKDAMFVIVGSGPERGNLEQWVSEQGLGNRVKIVGAVPQRDIPPYFWAADVFLLPSEEEGFPHVLLEAMAAGVPYVASDVGGVREITPQALQEFIVPSGDVSGFAGNVLSLIMKPPAEFSSIAQAEQEWVKQYDIHAVLPRFVALFRKL